MIELSAQRNEILPVIYEALKNEETEDWSAEHLFDITAVFAKQGDERAKQTVYECFDKYAQKGDWRLLKSIAEKYKNEDTVHSLAVSYIRIYRANPTKECKEPLEAVYRKTTCEIHRTDLVEILIENKVLSDRIRKEIQFDCNAATGRLFHEYRKSQN